MSKRKPKYGIGDFLYDKRDGKFYRCRILSVKKDNFEETYTVYYTNKKHDFCTGQYYKDEYCIDCVDVNTLYTKEEFQIISQEISVKDREEKRFFIVSLKHKDDFNYKNHPCYPLWKSGFLGYTTSIKEAGIYSLNDVAKAYGNRVKNDKIIKPGLLGCKYYKNNFASVMVDAKDYQEYFKFWYMFD